MYGRSVVIAINAVFIVPLIAGRICDLQPGILHNLQRGKDCSQVVAVGFLTILAVPGTFFLASRGPLSLLWLPINQILYKRFRNVIKNDWGGKVSDSKTRHIDK